jgi:hypothetical protein
VKNKIVLLFVGIIIFGCGLLTVYLSYGLHAAVGSGDECDICVPIPEGMNFDCRGCDFLAWEGYSTVCEGWTSDMCKATYGYTCMCDVNGELLVSKNTLTIWMSGCCSTDIYVSEM